MLCRPMLVNLLMCPRAKLTAPSALWKAPTSIPVEAEALSREAGGNSRIAPELCRLDGTRGIQREFADPSGARPSAGCETGQADRPYQLTVALLI